MTIIRYGPGRGEWRRFADGQFVVDPLTGLCYIWPTDLLSPWPWFQVGHAPLIQRLEPWGSFNRLPAEAYVGDDWRRLAGSLYRVALHSSEHSSNCEVWPAKWPHMHRGVDCNERHECTCGWPQDRDTALAEYGRAEGEVMKR